MGKLLESLEKYFNETPNEVIEEDFKELAHLNEIGPDVIEYAKYVKEFQQANKEEIEKIIRDYIKNNLEICVYKFMDNVYNDCIGVSLELGDETISESNEFI